jgi:hypothetical protein
MVMQRLPWTKLVPVLVGNTCHEATLLMIRSSRPALHARWAQSRKNGWKFDGSHHHQPPMFSTPRDRLSGDNVGGLLWEVLEACNHALIWSTHQALMMDKIGTVKNGGCQKRSRCGEPNPDHFPPPNSLGCGNNNMFL